MTNTTENKLTVRPLIFDDFFLLAPIFRKLQDHVDVNGYKIDKNNLDENGNPTLIPLTKEEYGNKLVFQLVGHMDLVKDDIYELISSLTNLSIEEVGKLGIKELLSVFSGLLGDKEFAVFLNQAKALA